MKLWIARDSNNSLFLHDEKPELEKLYGYWYSDNSYQLDRDEFPEVTFENSPQEVELNSIKENGE